MTEGYGCRDMRDILTGFQLQVALYRRHADMLVPLLTAPLYSVIFVMVLRHGGRPDLAGYAALAPFYMSLWWFALYSGGWVIQADRWESTVEYLVAAPAQFVAVVLGRVGATLLPGIAAFVEVWVFARYLLRADVTIHHLFVFSVSLGLTLFAMATTSLLMAALFVLARNAVTFSNSASFPFYLLGGILVPITLLPEWLQPFSRVVFLSWSAQLLRGSMAAEPVPGAGLALVMILILGCIALAAAYAMLGLILNRVRRTGELSLR